MKTGVVFFFAVLLCCGLGFAQSLNGKTIVVTTKGMVENVPVSLPAKGADGAVAVMSADGKHFPATLREGELTFLYTGSGGKLMVHAKDGAAKPAVVVTQDAAAKRVDVAINGEAATSFHYTTDAKRPYLWPVLSESGVHVTRAWPMGDPVEGYKQDHPHHKSLYTAHGDVNGVDCWSDVEESGFQVTKNVTCGSGDAYGWIVAQVEWQDKDHKALLEETREYRFYATPAAGRLIDAKIDLHATNGQVTFGDTKEGGMMAVRMRPELTGDNGTITNAQGDVGESNTWGKPSAWCDYSGPLEGIGWRGITIFDSPKNLRYPSSWHVRNYGLMGANCFGWSFFAEKDYNKPLLPSNDGTYVLPANDTLTFNYRVYVHSGDVTKAGAATRHIEYVSPPTASWE